MKTFLLLFAAAVASAADINVRTGSGVWSDSKWTLGKPSFPQTAVCSYDTTVTTEKKAAAAQVEVSAALVVQDALYIAPSEYDCATGTGIGCKSCAAHSDRTQANHCASCNDGHHLNGANCEPFVTCGPGQGRDAATNTCVPCVAGANFSSTESTDTCATANTALTCIVGKGRVNATVEADYFCEDCVAGVTYSDEDSKGACAAANAALTCPEGEGRVAATTKSDFYCEPCKFAAGKFSDSADKTACQMHELCATGEYEKTAPTEDANGNGVSDRKCYAHKECTNIQ